MELLGASVAKTSALNPPVRHATILYDRQNPGTAAPILPSAGTRPMTLGLLPDFDNTAALRYFYEVARYGSFRLAAAKIHIAASAISRQIQLLETELETSLFTRRRSGLHLTATGAALLHRVERAMEELALGRSEIDTLHGIHKGTVRVGINETIARDFFADFLVRFRRDQPSVRFEVTVGNSDHLEQILLRNELDVIIGYAVQPRTALQQVCAFQLQTCLAVPKSHPLAGEKSLRLTDFLDEDLILPSAQSMLRHVLDAMFSKVAMTPKSSLTTDSFEFMTDMVIGGCGVGCQLRLRPGVDPVRPEIVYVPIREPEVKSAVLACCILKGQAPSATAAIFLEILQDRLTTWCGDGGATRRGTALASDRATKPAARAVVSRGCA
jgi:DNA-binding transcriptional LysR family regulator